jgi:hypothetical protein
LPQADERKGRDATAFPISKRRPVNRAFSATGAIVAAPVSLKSRWGALEVSCVERVLR